MATKVRMATKVPVATKVSMATKVLMATKVMIHSIKSYNGSKKFKLNKKQQIFAVLASYVIWAYLFRRKKLNYSNLGLKRQPIHAFWS